MASVPVASSGAIEEFLFAAGAIGGVDVVSVLVGAALSFAGADMLMVRVV